MRWIVRGIGLIAALLLLAAVSLYFFFDANRYRGRIQAELEKSLGRPVQLGSLRLKLLPPAVAVENLSIGEDPAFPTGKPFLMARELAVQARLGPLFRGEIEVDSLRMVEPAIELVRSTAGKWNTDSIGQSGGRPAPGGADPAITLAKLSVENGRVGVTEQGVRTEYREIDLSLLNLGVAGRPSQFKAAVRFSDKVALALQGEAEHDRKLQLLRITSAEAKLGGLRLTGQGTVGTGANAAIDLRLQAQESSISEVAEAAAAIGAGFLPGTKVSGTASAEIAVRGTQDKPEITGGVKAAKLEVSRAEWKLPVRVPEIQVTLTPGLAKSNRFLAQCGNTRMTAAFSVAQPGAKDAFLASTLSANDARLEELLHIAGAFGLKSAAAMGGAGDVTLDAKVMGRLTPDAPMAYSGSGRLRNATLRVPALSKPVTVQQADLRFEQENAILENVVVAVAGSTLRGSVAVKRFSAPQVRFQVDADQINAAEWRGITKPEAPGAPSVAAGSLPAAPLLTKITGGGTVRVGRIVYDKLTLNDVRAEATLDRGLLRLDPLSAELYGGRHTGHISVDLRTEATQVALNSHIERVEANSLVSSMTSLKKLVYGLVAGEAALSFTSKPGAEIASSLNGTFQLRLSDGKLAGINLLNELAQIAKALGYARKVDPDTGIVKLAATLKIKDGVASTNDLRMDFAGGSLAAQGIIGLADQSLKLKMTPVLSRATSDQFGGGKVGGILTSALSNRNGELVIPVLVSGTVAAPRFVPDAEMMARMKLEGLVPALSNPAALGSTIKGAMEAGKQGNVSGVIDAITGRQPPNPPQLGEAPPPEEKAAEPGRKPVESLIELLKRKREKK